LSGARRPDAGRRLRQRRDVPGRRVGAARRRADLPRPRRVIAKELLARKRDGGNLAADEIAQLVGGITDGSLTEGQVAAFAMGVCGRGMARAECVALTDAMTRSGRVLDWRDLNKPVVDKHSTGGVGDKTSLMLAPILAAAGAAVPMISGRGLGHTGGT